MPDRIAYLPLDTHPEAAPDAAIDAALAFAAALGCKVQAQAFAVEIPPVASPLGGYLINIEGMARMAEDRSQAECARLQAMVAAKGHACTTRKVAMGGALDTAATEARYFDLALVPWAAGTATSQDMAQALVFGSGLPVILVPAAAPDGPLDHVAVAWDESRVAARALGDALRLVAPGGRVSVLTVHDEKPLSGGGLSETLAAALRRRGYEAAAVDLSLQGKPIGATLQDGALAAGARILAMGGFGPFAPARIHSGQRHERRAVGPALAGPAGALTGRPGIGRDRARCPYLFDPCQSGTACPSIVL